MFRVKLLPSSSVWRLDSSILKMEAADFSKPDVNTKRPHFSELHSINVGVFYITKIQSGFDR